MAEEKKLAKKANYGANPKLKGKRK